MPDYGVKLTEGRETRTDKPVGTAFSYQQINI
nr:MAG TPA: hypothetical protein [Caudoviricetes sp.]